MKKYNLKDLGLADFPKMASSSIFANEQNQLAKKYVLDVLNTYDSCQCYVVEGQAWKL